MNENLSHIATKLRALEIILSSPRWPERGNLCESGRILYDCLLDQAKEFSLAIAESNHSEFIRMAHCWVSPAKNFIDDEVINHSDSTRRLANRRMLRVYKYYMDSMGIAWQLIEKGKEV